MMDLSKLKLVIWDLDDTFWKGTLSEGPVELIGDNVDLLKALAESGIMSSICSKNDGESVARLLEKFGIADLFIFPSVDWTPKGQRLGELIKTIGLRPVNCLLLDDNPVNRQEARFYVPELNVAGPEAVADIKSFVTSVTKSDPEMKRLKQYHVLEKKTKAKEISSSNEAFLFDSDTRVEIHRDCIEHFDRISELVKRTNQLNFTKTRSTAEDLMVLFNDSSVDSGYVTVTDKYGDYGIVGFFAVKENRCIHFLFSCRTIGQGVEQYVYASLGYPMLDVVGEVVNGVTTDPAPVWINQNTGRTVNVFGNLPKSVGKVVLKGGCDLKIMSEYISAENIIEEFTYPGERGNIVEHMNHSVNYLSMYQYSEDEKASFIRNYPFSDPGMFQTSIFRGDVDILFISTMSEPNLGIYENKNNGIRFAWGEYLFPLTDKNNWKGYIEGTLFTAGNYFTEEWLSWFYSNHVFCGRLSPEQILDNAKRLLKMVPARMKVCFILGSETPFERNTQPNYVDRHLDYAAINRLFRCLEKEDNRVLLIDVNDYIRGQEDFNNNINHFKRRVYYEMASRANFYIKSLTGAQVRQKSRFYLFYKSLIDEIGFMGFYQTKFWQFARKPYVAFKNIIKGN